MILKKLTLKDFGIYGGSWEFDLTPQPSGDFNRPIILFKGKNGAGKTTLTEAIRLCLHGPLALGSRVSRAEYEQHLSNWLHRKPDTEKTAKQASLTLELDYVDAGHKVAYTISRCWAATTNNIKETVEIVEDTAGNSLAEIETDQQRNDFLRELVSPRVANLFFFDGEKLEALTNDHTAAGLLRDTVEFLFGLSLVDQLQTDLDIFLTRQSVDKDAQQLQQQLTTLQHKKHQLLQEQDELRTRLNANEQELTRLSNLREAQKQKIASAGGWFAKQLDETETARQEIEVEIEWLRKQAQELANGLLPFAITPTMCALVADRLHIEQDFEQAVSAQRVLDKKFDQIAKEISNPTYWDEFDVALNDETRQRLLTKLETTIKQTAQPPQVDHNEIMLRVSEKDRQSMLGWIDQSATEVPAQFCRIIQRLDHLEEKRKQFDRSIELVPSDETLKPLAETLYEQGRQLGALEIHNQDLLTKMQRLERNIEQLENERKRIRRHLDEHESHNRRIHLAIKSQQALEDYTEKLRGEKLRLLASTIVRRFNHLCRKEDLISGAKIDPNSYKITLLRRGQTFAREQLSAGEKQLLATAIIWALREISNAPFPVILDTPLGRLDSDHRLSMLDYFPQASHQVILLATDTEIGPELEQRLEPALTRVYDLNELSESPHDLALLMPREIYQQVQNEPAEVLDAA